VQLDIVKWPATVLATKAKPVQDVSDEIKSLVTNMHETMKSSGGIGLAANQVGVLSRIIVIKIPFDSKEPSSADTSPDAIVETEQWWHNKSFTLINPQIVTHSSTKVKSYEGCLSFPDIYEYIPRFEKVTVKYLDENADTQEVEADGLFSICLQHEIDHLDGITFIKRMSRLKSSLVKKKLSRNRSTKQI